MAAFNLLHPEHFMIGIDPHDALIPPDVFIPSLPHSVGAHLRGGAGTAPGAFGAQVLHTPRVRVRFEEALQRSTDISDMILHIQSNVLIPIVIMPTSKSVSTFGAGTVRVMGRPVATAVFGKHNVNLNCGDPLDVPTGWVDAPNTVRAGMTWGDVYAGLLDMIYKMARSLLEGIVFGLLVSAAKLLGKIPGIKRVIAPAFKRIVENHPGLSKILNKAFDEGFSKVLERWDYKPEEFDDFGRRYDDENGRVFR